MYSLYLATNIDMDANRYLFFHSSFLENRVTRYNKACLSLIRTSFFYVRLPTSNFSQHTTNKKTIGFDSA